MQAAGPNRAFWLVLITVVCDIMLPVVLAITHTLTMYYVFSGLAVKGLIEVLSPTRHKIGHCVLPSQSLNQTAEANMHP